MFAILGNEPCVKVILFVETEEISEGEWGYRI